MKTLTIKLSEKDYATIFNYVIEAENNENAKQKDVEKYLAQSIKFDVEDGAYSDC